jgi:hypothetical protein
MRRPLLLLFVGIALAAGSFSCSGGVDTKTPPPADDDDDDDDGTTATPTPTPGVTPTPPAGLEGDPWTVTATPPEYSCSFGLQIVTFGSNGVAVIGIGQTSGALYFDIGLHLNPNIGVGDEPSGTVDGNGDFTQSFSYCGFDGFGATTKYYGTWTGTFAPDGLSFDSTLLEDLYVSTGDHRTTCATTMSTADAPFCANPGASFTVHGVKQ